MTAMIWFYRFSTVLLHISLLLPIPVSLCIPVSRRYVFRQLRDDTANDVCKFTGKSGNRMSLLNVLTKLGNPVGYVQIGGNQCIGACRIGLKGFRDRVFNGSNFCTI